MVGDTEEGQSPCSHKATGSGRDRYNNDYDIRGTRLVVSDINECCSSSEEKKTIPAGKIAAVSDGLFEVRIISS